MKSLLKKVNGIGVFIVISLIPVFSYSSENSKIVVYYRVVCENENLRALLHKGIKREFTLLKDVELSRRYTRKVNWMLTVNAYEGMIKKQNKMGIIVSVLIKVPLKNQTLMEVLENLNRTDLYVEGGQVFQKSTTDDAYNIDYFKTEFTKDALKKGCREIVAAFDSKILAKVRIQRKGKGSVIISSEPEGAKIFIDGDEKGITPLKIDSLKGGRHILTLEKNRYLNDEMRIVIKTNEVLEVNRKLFINRFGTLIVNTNPTNAELYIDDDKVGVTNYKNTKIEPGNYELKISKQTYQEIIKNIIVKMNSKFEFNLDLKHTAEYNNSIKVADKSIAKKKRQRMQKIIFSVLSVGSGGAAAYMETKANEKKNEQGTFKKEYDGYVRNRNILLGISGGSLLSLGISFVF